MEKIICKPGEHNNFFLIACVLFAVDVVYSLWRTITYYYPMMTLMLIVSLAVCVLFFMSYMGKLKLYIPFVVLSFQALFNLFQSFLGRNGLLSFLEFATIIYATLCVMGIINFKVNFKLPEGWGSRANSPCVIGAGIFAFIGMINLFRCLYLLGYGLPFIYILDMLCYFGALVLVMLGTEAEPVSDTGFGAYGNANNTYGQKDGKGEQQTGYGGQQGANNGSRDYAGAGSRDNDGKSGGYGQTDDKSYSDGNHGQNNSFYKSEGILSELKHEENIVMNVVLGIITLGIYWFIWWYRVCRRIRLIEDKNPACGGELACIILVPFYSIYWFYTRGQRLTEGAKRFKIDIKDNSVLYMVLAIFGLSIVSFILMQTEMNTFADKLNRGINDFTSSRERWEYRKWKEHPYEEQKDRQAWGADRNGQGEASGAGFSAASGFADGSTQDQGQPDGSFCESETNNGSSADDNWRPEEVQSEKQEGTDNEGAIGRPVGKAYGEAGIGFAAAGAISGESFNKEDAAMPVSDGAAAAEAADNKSAKSIVEAIRMLAELKEQGILTEEEFSAKKKELLDRM